MPLKDHFHSPVNDKHHWSEFHGQWPGEIVRSLFDLLPTGYQAGPRMYLGSSFEVDVATTKDDQHEPGMDLGEGGVATLTSAPTLTIQTELIGPDEYEVRVYDAARERRLVAAIEIVSPANKDRPESRDQFVSKVAGLLQQRVCVSIIDLVTERHANLYAELLSLLGGTDPNLSDPPPSIYACTLRTRKTRKCPQMLDAWYYPMQLNQTLPTILLWLSEKKPIMLPLEPSYQETCRLLRIV
ncbi:MAG: DUF4058 family protein [Fimbriiglobus sp.]